MSDGIRETSFCEQFGGLVAQFSAKEGFEVLVEIHGSACGTSANGAFFDAKRGLLFSSEEKARMIRAVISTFV